MFASTCSRTRLLPLPHPLCTTRPPSIVSRSVPHLPCDSLFASTCPYYRSPPTTLQHTTTPPPFVPRYHPLLYRVQYHTSPAIHYRVQDHTSTLCVPHYHFFCTSPLALYRALRPPGASDEPSTALLGPRPDQTRPRNRAARYLVGKRRGRFGLQPTLHLDHSTRRSVPDIASNLFHFDNMVHTQRK